ncbi:hypothetical protein CXB51_022254 [Gossypium anomalum]|uniref:protein-synthesizing GTPase n=1 Tax=Gossypium anomalum TaxID=47600 RepID=A0A8J5YJP8_9ROSI|nr:hypothetical protein CXB51_022254 [Gossypium anomalum]
MSKKGLMEQDLSKLDVTKLHPLSPEVISRQATINIGNVLTIFSELLVACIITVPIVMVILTPSRYSGDFFDQSFDLDFNLSGTIGHVAHGKSTVVVKAISGFRLFVLRMSWRGILLSSLDMQMQRYTNVKMNDALVLCATSRLITSNCFLRQLIIVLKKIGQDRPVESVKLGTSGPSGSAAYGSGKEDSPLCDVPGFENCRMKLLRHVSFVDCPGHDILMATMLNGAAIMDGALLLIAANESCPQPQTSEHLAAVEIMRLHSIIILQNKVDLIQENVAINQHEAIQKFIQGTVADGAPVVPISAQLKYNIDVVCEYIVKKIPIPERNFVSPPNMIVIRSFDVNKPGFEVDEIKGGVAGGSILRGVLKVNQFIEVRPGIVVKDESGNIKCTPIYSRIVSLYAEQNELQYAVPGGLIGVGTTMDPTLTRADRLVGQVLGEVGSLPEVYVELEVNFFLLRRLLGVRTKGSERQGKVSKLAKGEILMLNIAREREIALSRRVEKHWRLIGWGQIQAGTTIEVPPCPFILKQKDKGSSENVEKGLMEQDLSKLDVTKLHPLSPEVISRQATINIGTIGHVAHGKSTVVKAISGVQTVRFKNELERILLSSLDMQMQRYTNVKMNDALVLCATSMLISSNCFLSQVNAVFKKLDKTSLLNQSNWAYGSGKEDSPLCDVPGFENCRMKLLRHVSFVDCPGHDILMATMLNGAAIMDGALLLIAANESCPQPQTSEHLAAVEIMRLQHIIILQNKVDLIQENVAINQHEAIQKFIQGTVADGAPVVPISAQLKYNIDVVCEYIVKKIPIPERNFVSPPNMIVIRSFDVNKPGFEVDEIKGGVAGGSILRGVLKVNQFIEVRPGIVVKDESGNIKCTPIYSRIVSLLVGQVLGEVGSLPEVYVELEVNFFLLRRLLGVRTKGSERQGKVSKLAKGEILMLNIGSMSTGARVIAVKNDLAKLQLTSPVCTSKGEKIALSRRVEKHCV